MKTTLLDPPRRYRCGRQGTVEIADCARLELAPGEQVTFLTGRGAEYDVTRKSWGFYATPSMNARLASFGWRSALVRNAEGHRYLFLVERGGEDEFQRYLAEEAIEVAAWLDDAGPRCLCGGTVFQNVFEYHAPPEGENRFPLPTGTVYDRRVVRCPACGHFLSLHDLDLRGLYQGAYVDSVYGGDRLRLAFDRVNALPPERSDNAGRVARILRFAAGLALPASPAVLDVGAGLAVFPRRMQQSGWRATALDPDPRAAAHARQVAGVEAICAGFLQAANLGRYHAVTFNKVLEHVPDPVAMLARAKECLAPGGFVYVEVPDGEAAAAHGPEREEFFIEHHHIFSAISFAILSTRAGFQVIELERLREPSGKYTLRAFLTEAAGRI
jgi:SAM-dependent methyltransferase